jgi:Type ISP C-terminal specificity domain/N-6 DNA Methylase
VETAGAALSAPPALLRLFDSFFRWQPVSPRSARELADTSAHLCRLLREEVAEQLVAGSRPLTHLAEDWRRLLFPTASDAVFADGYAQAVTFGLLMARARGIRLGDGLDRVARELSRSNSLIGTALHLLTGDAEGEDTLKTSLATLTRVLDVVSWPAISKGDPEAWLYFYEYFLSAYDNELKKKTGSYYTPPEVVTAMVRLVDEVLRHRERFGLAQGLASQDVTLADPATGTGTFLLGVLRRIAASTEADQGAGAVPGVIEAALRRTIGFELQFGPYAVAQLRLLTEVAELTGGTTGIADRLRLYVADTLGNPDEEEEWIPHILEPLAESRRAANAVKREEPITVVIGNPPYKERARGQGGWIESGGANAEAPLSKWMPPPAWGVGAHAKHLRNLYVYFWRWAMWEWFGEGEPLPDTPAGRREGIVCFITVAGFLNGPGFQKMRADLRRDTDEIWVIDCSPEGHQPSVSSRIFQGVQQPVCIVMAARLKDCDAETPARVRFRALPAGRRERKFAAISELTTTDAGWTDCPSDWRAPFLPAGVGAWATFPALADLFLYNGSGVMPGRTWVIAPDSQTLRERWARLTQEKNAERREVLFHPHLVGGRPGDRHSNRVVESGLPGHGNRPVPVANDNGPCETPLRYGFRSFDRQWIIPDNRLINRPNPTLWAWHSSAQVYATALLQHSPTSGPAITFTGLIPDLHHYKGSFGGRAFPLWADAEARQPNVKPALLHRLGEEYGRQVGAEDVMAYIAAVAAQPAYVARFRDDLVQPGLRLPITAEAALFAEAHRLGREVIWLHTFGERFAAPDEGRPAGPPRLPAAQGPRIPAEGAIPSSADRMPDRIVYDAASRRLHVGEGYVDNVPPEVWAYEVSGKQVLVQWFSYRGRDRGRPLIGDRRKPSPLGGIQPDTWLAEYTTELLNVLHVLGRLVTLQPAQADLLQRICAGPLLSDRVLREAGALDAPADSAGRRRARDDRQAELLD